MPDKWPKDMTEYFVFEKNLKKAEKQLYLGMAEFAVMFTPLDIFVDAKDLVLNLVNYDKENDNMSFKIRVGLGFMSVIGPGSVGFFESIGDISKTANKMDNVNDVAKGLDTINKPQKVIGHYPEYVELSNELGTKSFSIPDNVWNKMTKAEQWEANKKFLDRAIAKGTEFNLATPLDKVRKGSYLEKEIKYLTSQGYKLSKDGTKLVK